MPASTKPTDSLQWQISDNKEQQEATYIGQQQQTIGFAAGSKSYSDGSTITHSLHRVHTNQAEPQTRGTKLGATADPSSCRNYPPTKPMIRLGETTPITHGVTREPQKGGFTFCMCFRQQYLKSGEATCCMSSASGMRSPRGRHVLT